LVLCLSGCAAPEGCDGLSCKEEWISFSLPGPLFPCFFLSSWPSWLSRLSSFSLPFAFGEDSTVFGLVLSNPVAATWEPLNPWRLKYRSARSSLYLAWCVTPLPTVSYFSFGSC